MTGWEGLGRIAISLVILGVPTFFVGICAAISHGETKAVKAIMQTALLCLGTALALGTLLALRTVWS
jgi:hypothetical protein